MYIHTDSSVKERQLVDILPLSFLTFDVSDIGQCLFSKKVQ